MQYAFQIAFIVKRVRCVPSVVLPVSPKRDERFGSRTYLVFILWVQIVTKRSFNPVYIEILSLKNLI